MIILSPVGILLPRYFKAGTAWGEWSEQEMRRAAGYVPDGIKRIGSIWHAPLPDYSRPGASPASQSVWYIVSAGVGVALISAAGLGIRRLIIRKGGE